MMLINCPKCGFSQPKDQYCASCGVDMTQFKPASTPLWKAIAINPVFLIAMTLAIVMGSVSYIRVKQREELASRAELLRSGPLMVSQSESASKVHSGGAPPSDNAPSREMAHQNEAAIETPAPTTAAAAPVALPSPASVGAATAGAAPSTTLGGKFAPPTAATTQTLRATFYYTEVTTADHARFENEAVAGGQMMDFGDFKLGTLANISKRMNSKYGVVVRQVVNRTFDSKTLQQQWFLGTKMNDGQEVGLSTLITLEPANGHLRGEIEVLKSFPETAGPEVSIRKSSSPSFNFDLNGKQGLMMQIPLPTNLPDMIEGAIPVDGLLSIFNSNNFKNHMSEFTLFVEFDTPNP